VDFKTHLENAWDLTLEFISPLIIITLVMFSIWFLSLGILVPVTLAGYTQSLLRMMREGRDPTIRDLFSEFNLFLPLIGFSILVALAIIIGFIFVVLPGFLIAILITFACLYMLPLMTDRRLDLPEAVKTSYAMGIESGFGSHLVTVAIYLGILAIGSSFFIGALFTQPLATLFMLSVYSEKLQ
jgi:uncharacterized membrane protein